MNITTKTTKTTKATKAHEEAVAWWAGAPSRLLGGLGALVVLVF